jgi:hypothetical protein
VKTLILIAIFCLLTFTNTNAQERQSNFDQRLIAACGAKGLGVDFVNKTCVFPNGGETNPRDLYQPFQAPVPRNDSDSLTLMCSRLGKVPNFATGQCM